MHVYSDPPDSVLFRRGDVDGDTSVRALTDGLRLLAWGFAGAAEPPCMDAADVDNNGRVHALIDSLYLLLWAFADGPAPPEPSTECGEDPEGGNLGCLSLEEACR